MIETGVIIGLNGEPIFWHTPGDRTLVSLPDSRNLWDVLWENREKLAGFAHSHPGSGMPGPSYTDVTTFSAIELALGKRLDWWITSSDNIVVVRWTGPADYTYQRSPMDVEPSWASTLRRLSEEHTRTNVEGRAT